MVNIVDMIIRLDYQVERVETNIVLQSILGLLKLIVVGLVGKLLVNCVQ